MRFGPPLVLLLPLAACTRLGEVQWSDGRAPLRTAFWQERPSEQGTHLLLALSTSEFPCALDLFGDDPAVVTENTNALYSDACREGARHLVVDLWRANGPADGTYPGRSGAGETDLALYPRFSTTGWFAVEEAGVQFIDGINRTYAPVSYVVAPAGGDGGEVRLESRQDRFEGDLWLPESDVSATFDVEACPAGPTVLDDLFDALALLQVVC